MFCCFGWFGDAKDARNQFLMSRCCPAFLLVFGKRTFRSIFCHPELLEIFKWSKNPFRNTERNIYENGRAVLKRVKKNCCPIAFNWKSFLIPTLVHMDQWQSDINSWLCVLRDTTPRKISFCLIFPRFFQGFWWITDTPNFPPILPTQCIPLCLLPKKILFWESQKKREKERIL